MFKFFLGTLVTTVCWLYYYHYHVSESDMEIMIAQNEVMMLQSEVIEAIKSNCQNRNWLEFNEELYVCMPVNQMFHQLSNPPAPLFSEKSENDA